MVKINPVKHVSAKVTRVKESTFPQKAKTLEEANISLLNFVVKEKRELVSLKGKAHKIGQEDTTTKKVKKHFPRLFNKTQKKII